MSVVGEAALAAFFDALFNKLTSLYDKSTSDKQVHKEIEKWGKKLQLIHAVLADAGQKKQMKNEQSAEIWLSNLQELAYDADDILDMFATESLGRKLMNEHQATTGTTQKLIPTCNTVLHPSSIMFKYKMVSKIKKITRRLEELTMQMSILKLTDNYVGRFVATQNTSSQSTSLVNEADVYGRQAEKEKLLDLLFQNDRGTEAGFSVISIVGMGGIGKTTLAQLAYKESKGHFDICSWACVSEEFNIIQVTKTILQSITHQTYNLDDLNSLQERLEEELSGKKFLIVLDDVWNDKYEDWTKLRSPFVAGAPGSKIIVTTRSYNVSSTMKTVPHHFSMKKLTEDDSLSMLAHHALGARDFSGHQDLKEIGLRIVKKCDGLPLATKAIGGLLRSQRDREAWKDILQSEVWSLSGNDNTILPALQLSYYHLSSQLKQCFTYCSLVPKDYEFTEQEIVQLWMAEGFLNDASTKKEVEDSGKRCFKELVSRSFFQESRINKSHFVMHDLINDLARSTGGKVFFRMEADEIKFSKEIRHSSYVKSYFDSIKKFKSFYEARHLRTFLSFMMTRDYTGHYYISNNVVCDLLPKLRCLRVLSLKGYRITKIPGFIGDLKHLRYLDFSYTEIRSLPDSICTLYNLETLLLRECWRIEKLPSNIGILVNLCHLDITGVDLKEMPSGIGELRNLRTLSNFIVGQDGGRDIREMQNLSNLKGQLSISNLQNVDKAQYAWKAKLSSKSDLDILKLQWCKDFNENLRKRKVEENVLSVLRPHEDLKVLTIKYYAGTLLPTWVGDPSFTNLQSLNLKDCQNCTLLPTIGKLPLLKDLYIKGMSSVTCVGSEFYGDNWQNVFPSLETLHFEDMPEWKEWKSCEVNKSGQMFPHLRELFIKICPKFIGSLPNDLFSLEKLVIRGCQQSVVHISNLPLLRELDIDGCNELVFGNSTDLWSVKEIVLKNISKFTCVAEEVMMSELVKVASLCIDGHEDLTSLWQTRWGQLGPLRSLRTLELLNCLEDVYIGAAAKEEETEGIFRLEIPCNIEDVRIAYCEGLTNLSKTFSNFTCLRELKIEACPKLVSFSMDNLPPTLRTLEIWRCDNLQCLLDDRENINFSSTSLLESLKVIGCGGLSSLSSGKLPLALRSLEVWSCPSLEVIAREFGDNMILEIIQLVRCENIRYLSQGLDKLSRLQDIRIEDCPNLICFPDRGLPTNLKFMSLFSCKKLEALPDLQSLQLEGFFIGGCTRVKSIPDGGLPLPATLSSLVIQEPNISKAVMEWGELHTLTFLTLLDIDGSNCTDMVSFLRSQDETGMNMNMNMKLPSSLTLVEIRNFKNLRKLSCSFQNLSSLQSLSIYDCPKLESLPKNIPSLRSLRVSNCLKLESFPQSLTSLRDLDIYNCMKLKSLPQNLTSLQYLSIGNCPKLKSIAEKEMLHSLLYLSIMNCPKLKKRCKRDKGKLWSYISHIPFVEIDGKFIYE